MKLRISGDFGGMVIVVIAGVLAASLISGILEFIKNRILKNSAMGKKIIGALIALVWVAAIVLVALDIFNIAPFIRDILFAIIPS